MTSESKLPAYPRHRVGADKASLNQTALLKYHKIDQGQTGSGQAAKLLVSRTVTPPGLFQFAFVGEIPYSAAQWALPLHGAWGRESHQSRSLGPLPAALHTTVPSLPWAPRPAPPHRRERGGLLPWQPPPAPPVSCRKPFGKIS